MGMHIDLDLLPLGVTNLTQFKNYGLVYIDKTDLVAKLARKIQPIFISRPRRFGKTTLLQTLEILFSKGKEPFKGLKLYDKWSDNRVYKVIHLDFSSSFWTTFDGFLSSLYSQIKQEFLNKDISIDGVTSEHPGDFFRDCLKKSSSENFVFLLDEYDDPLIVAKGISEELYANMLKFYNDFFKTVKALAGNQFRFTLITGILKLSQTSIFSGGNSFNDLSMSSDFGELLGITDSELHTYFDEYIANLGKTNHLTKEQTYQLLKENYNGYCFDEECSTSVYNPWSILGCLQKPKRGFEPYWMDSGSPESLIISHYRNSKNKTELEDRIKPILDLNSKSGIIKSESELTSKSSFEDIDDVSLLYQAGFLTIKELVGDKKFKIDFPNQEVRSSINRIILEKILSLDIDDNIASKNDVLHDLMSGDHNVVSRVLNNILRLFSYNSKQLLLSKESMVVDMIYSVLVSKNIRVNRENLNLSGRSDLEVFSNDRCVVFEFKIAKSLDDIEVKKQEAFIQVKKHHYGETSNVNHTDKYAVIVVDEPNDGSTNFLKVFKVE